MDLLSLAVSPPHGKSAASDRLDDGHAQPINIEIKRQPAGQHRSKPCLFLTHSKKINIRTLHMQWSRFPRPSRHKRGDRMSIRIVQAWQPLSREAALKGWSNQGKTGDSEASKPQNNFNRSQSNQKRSSQQSGIPCCLCHWKKGRAQNQSHEESKGNLKTQH